MKNISLTLTSRLDCGNRQKTGKSRLILLFLFFIISAIDLSSAAKPVHLVAWGDSEGMLRRPGDDPKALNPAVLQMIPLLKNLDRENPIDLILCTGDFVRFDPIPKKPNKFLFFKKWPKELLGKFYVTIGGDEEFTDKKFDYYNKEIGPWLKNTIDLSITQTALTQEALREAHDSDKHYFYLERAGVHVFSLWSPDNLDEIERTPQWANDDIFNPTAGVKTAQYQWLVRNLWQIRTARNDDQPIIILSHRPVLNRAGEHLLELFDAFDVDLVLSGDEHVLAKKNYNGTVYVVTGMAGDSLGMGGCDRLNKNYRNYRGNNFASSKGPYELCLPQHSIERQNQPYVTDQDHYLDITINGKMMVVEVINIDTGKKMDELTFAETFIREHATARQNKFWEAVQ